MAGYCTGRNPRVGREEFVLTYLEAMWEYRPPGKAVREKYGMSVKHYEEMRAMLSKHGWLPYGHLPSCDRPRVLRQFKAKLLEVQAGQLAREDAVAAKERRAELKKLKARAAEVASVDTSTSFRPVLDRFGV